MTIKQRTFKLLPYEYRSAEKLSVRINHESETHDSNDCRVSEVKPKNPNVIGSEKHFPPHEYSIGNYEMFHKNLDNNTGRGMALFVSRSFEAPGVDFKTAPEAFIIVEVHLVKYDELLIVHTYLSDCGTEENKKSPST